MPILELLILPFKQDEATREAYIKTFWPTLAALLSGKKGMKMRTSRMMLSSNNSDVSSIFQPVMVVGWNAVSDFQTFVTGDELGALRNSFISLVTAATSPQLYDTDVEPRSVFGCALTEVFKVKIGDHKENKEKVKGAWGNFVKGVGEVKSLSGVSVNLNERTFVGAIGWESESGRDRVLKRSEVEELYGRLGDLESFVVKLDRL
ncbi:Uncharacterized protein BP5553_07248 [Venustampulla echinocandica]|uniref:Uncharacterized protein n=1 Tax=Venustampulla echinocandica TaxID=2656787 RepID=A0A370TIX9_9HELO|nr:Uncharacterized protein BP5553_07248 [Venustampulla echinocandica]RDL35317.1 Uncharacterized protein BP5553_07248 [Venustampulla echinocandica]